MNKAGLLGLTFPFRESPSTMLGRLPCCRDANGTVVSAQHRCLTAQLPAHCRSLKTDTIVFTVRAHAQLNTIRLFRLESYTKRPTVSWTWIPYLLQAYYLLGFTVKRLSIEKSERRVLVSKKRPDGGLESRSSRARESAPPISIHCKVI
jgi:hypothetical protein